jgi:lipid A 4'-phosphatase
LIVKFWLQKFAICQLMSIYRSYINARLFKWYWLFLIACLVFFELFPNTDLVIAAMTWNPEEQFKYANLAWVQISYLVFSKIHFLYLIVLIYFVIAQKISSKKNNRLRVYAGFLLVSLILGPGLVVNQVFKENWGRARPREVVNFGGSNRYTPPLQISQECDGNSSFVSGHAAGAFFILSLVWVFRHRRWLWLGMLSGGLVGLGRVLQGGHFLSDIVFSFWSVYGCSLVCAIWFGLRSPKMSALGSTSFLDRPIFK